MKVSIIIPCYNAEKTVKESVESALNQNFPEEDFEVIVVNDGSNDRTAEILESFGRKIKVINQKNEGAAKAVNKGFKTAKGKYLIKLDSDDLFEPDILKEMAVILDRNSDIDFVYSDYFEKTTVGRVKVVSTEQNIFNTVSVGIMFRKNKLEEEGFYNQDIGFPEYDLLLKTQGKWKGRHINKPLFWYIRRSESLTGSKKWLEEAMAELKKLHPEKLSQIKRIRNY